MSGSASGPLTAHTSVPRHPPGGCLPIHGWETRPTALRAQGPTVFSGCKLVIHDLAHSENFSSIQLMCSRVFYLILVKSIKQTRGKENSGNTMRGPLASGQHGPAASALAAQDLPDLAQRVSRGAALPSRGGLEKSVRVFGLSSGLRDTTGI